MFKNPGKKLKVLAVIMAILVLAGGVVTGVVMGASILDYDAAEGILTMLAGVAAGILAAFLLGLPIYAFGQLVEDTQKIRTAVEQRQF